MAELLIDKSRNLEDRTTGHVRHKVHHNLPRRNVHIDEPLNERSQMQRTVDNEGSSRTGDVVKNTQTSTENPRHMFYTDMASNPNGMWKNVRPKSRPKAVFGKKNSTALICVFHLTPETTEEYIRNYLNVKNVKILKMYIVSKPETFSKTSYIDSKL